MPPLVTLLALYVTSMSLSFQPCSRFSTFWKILPRLNTQETWVCSLCEHSIEPETGSYLGVQF